MEKTSAVRNRFLPKGLTILYEDRDLLIADKPAGLLSVATDKEKMRTTYVALTDYVRKGCAKSSKRLYVVHRLDRETSGILIFAKSHEAKQRLQDQWAQVVKRYLAVVHGVCAQPSGTISSYLVEEDKSCKVYSTSDSSRGRLSQTMYELIRVKKGFSLLELVLLTGRKNQIRVHLADLGHPIVGDRKYGRAGDAHPRLALHAKSITFAHPFTGRSLTIEAEIPAFFTTLVGPLEQRQGEEPPVLPGTLD